MKIIFKQECPGFYQEAIEYAGPDPNYYCDHYVNGVCRFFVDSDTGLAADCDDTEEVV
jgi:hypothetical protein